MVKFKPTRHDQFVLVVDRAKKLTTLSDDEKRFVDSLDRALLRGDELTGKQKFYFKQLLRHHAPQERFFYEPL
jgi:hypothetical protein